VRYFTISWKILHHVDVNGSKKLWQGCSLCNILSSFNKQSVNIWEMRRPVTGPLVEECCPIVGWYRILAAKQSWVFIVVFYVSWCAKCFWVLDCHAGLRTRGAKASKIDFQLCPLRMMSSDSLKLLQSLCNSTLRNIYETAPQFLNTIFLADCCTSAEKLYIITIHSIMLLTCFQIT